MRLIDADDLISKVKLIADYDWNDTRRTAYKDFLDALTEAPTAYDVDKVTHKIHCYFIEKIDNAEDREYCRLVNDNHAICNIVRSGGIGE